MLTSPSRPIDEEAALPDVVAISSDQWAPFFAAQRKAKRLDLLSENMVLRRLLIRYRTETPLGHQPHMITAEVDEVLAKELR